MAWIPAGSFNKKNSSEDLLAFVFSATGGLFSLSSLSLFSFLFFSLFVWLLLGLAFSVSR